MRLRGAETRDLPAVERLLAEAALPLVGVREGLGDFIVAEEGGAIVGVVGLEVRGGYGLLRSAAVQSGHRGRGLGGALVGQVIAAARARRLHALYLLTTTAAEYFPAFGFTVVDRAGAPPEMQGTDEFARACDATAVAMVLPLDTGA
jgi:amino-acid N-acetyltransferase